MLTKIEVHMVHMVHMLLLNRLILTGYEPKDTRAGVKHFNLARVKGHERGVKLGPKIRFTDF